MRRSEAYGDCENLVMNGGFEGVDGKPNGWYPTQIPCSRDHVVFAVNQEEKHSGERSVSIAIRETHPDCRVCYNWTQVVEGYQTGATYELSGWIKTKDLKETAWIVAQCWDEKKTRLLNMGTTQKSHPILGSSDWTLAKATFRIPEGTGEVRIRAGISTPINRGGKVWFDDFSLKKIAGT